MKSLLVYFSIATILLGVLYECAPAQGPGNGPGRGQGRGFGRGFGPGFGRGMQGRGFQGGRGHDDQQEGGQHGHDDRHDEDHEVFQFLLQNHSKIKRTVKELSNGVETLTESEDPEIAAKIKEHVEWMEYRIKETNPIRMRDPLFAELFRHTDKIVMKHEDTEKGVKVIETSQDPYVAKLVKEHAKVVSKFVERGFAEAMKNHAVPGKPNADKNENRVATAKPLPVIKDHGAVVQLPDAAQQPRSGTKVVIDLTRGGDPDKLNPAIEKVAKYVNLYAAAGREPAAGSFAIVFHGDATLAILNPDAYGEEFGTKGNPNTQLLMQLHEAGVEMYVCGQSLHAKKKSSQDVLVFVETAVSAFTANVNLQTDGYTYLPLGK